MFRTAAVATLMLARTLIHVAGERAAEAAEEEAEANEEGEGRVPATGSLVGSRFM